MRNTHENGHEARAVSVEVAGSMLGISRSAAYALVAANRLPGVVRLGPRLTRVSVAALETLLASASDASPTR